jgi:hypothetical protein
MDRCRLKRQVVRFIQEWSIDMSEIELKSDPAELRMTIQVTRKETGKVETYELVGTTDLETIKQLEKDNHGSHP